MITIDEIKENIKCPQFGDIDYGKWGALRLDQREAYKHLIDIIEGQEQEISRLNNIINELEQYLIYKMEEENKDAYDDETQVSDAYLVYEEILDKVKELRGK